MPDALRIGLLGPLQVRDETGRLIHVGGRQLRVLLILLALNAGRVVPVGSLGGPLGARIGTVATSSARAVGVRRRMPSVTFHERPWGSTSQSRTKTCAWPVLARK